MVNMKLILGIFCLLVLLVILYIITWALSYPDFAIMTAYNEHLPISVFNAYLAEQVQEDFITERCMTEENSTIYRVEGGSSPVTDYSYFDANGNLLCKGGTHADQNWVDEGTCPDISNDACEIIITGELNKQG